MIVIIVLGCSIKFVSTINKYIPDVILQSRLIKAIDVYNEYKGTSNDVIIIVSGGKVKGRQITESSVMKEFLTNNNIPSTAIFEEAASVNTIENCIYSYDLIKKILSKRITIQEINNNLEQCSYYGSRSYECGELTYPIYITLLTSEYHIARSLHIFNTFLPFIKITVSESTTPKYYLKFEKIKEARINVKASIETYLRNKVSNNSITTSTRDGISLCL